MTFTLFDISILTILILSSIMGIYRGFIYISINTLSFVASIFTAVFLYKYVNIFFHSYITHKFASSIISGVISYVISLVIFTLLFVQIIKLFKDVRFSIYDRFMGLLLGVFRGAAIVLAIFATISILVSVIYQGGDNKFSERVINRDKDRYPHWLKDSITTPCLDGLLSSVITYVPVRWLDRIKLPQNKEDSDKLDLNGSNEEKTEKDNRLLRD